MIPKPTTLSPSFNLNSAEGFRFENSSGLSIKWGGSITILPFYLLPGFMQSPHDLIPNEQWEVVFPWKNIGL